MMLSKLSYVLLLTVLGLSISSASLAQNPSELQNPTQIVGNFPQPKQKNPATRQETASQDQRGTEKMPLVIKGIPTEKTAEQSAEDREQREIKLALDRDLTKYTGQQALFTCVLVVVGIIQLCLFVWQLNLIRESLADTKIASNAALKTAESIIATERAYIFAKVDNTIVGTNPDKSTTITGEIQFLNYGKTPAMPTRCRWASQETSVVPQILGPADQDVPYWQDGLTIAPEKSMALIFTLNISAANMTDILNGTRMAYTFGLMEYKDIFGNARETGFCWGYNRNSIRRSRFDFILNSPLNYRT